MFLKFGSDFYYFFMALSNILGQYCHQSPYYDFCTRGRFL